MTCKEGFNKRKPIENW